MSFQAGQTVNGLLAEGMTHLQVFCCGDVVMKPLNIFPVSKQKLPLEEVVHLLKCSKCGNRASPGHVAPWKHGMKRYD